MEEKIRAGRGLPKNALRRARLDVRPPFAYDIGMFEGSATRKLFVVTCKRCKRDVPAGVSEFPFHSITVECCLCGDQRLFRPSEVFVGKADHLVAPSASAKKRSPDVERTLGVSEIANKGNRESNAISPGAQSQRQWTLLGGYAAFIAALLILTLTLSWSRAWVVVTMFAVSLPALIAFVLVDAMVSQEEPRKRRIRNTAFLFGMLPSLIGTAILIGHVSLIAMVVFIASVISWLLIIWLGSKQNGNA